MQNTCLDWSDAMTKSPNKWYSAGLHFECLQCGRCCSGPAQGYIWVTKHETQLIARHLNMPVGELKSKFLKRVGLRTTIIENPHTRNCIFLRPNKGCVIYQVRPSQCRSWPFWPGNLASPNAWNDAARKCPGINRGKLYSPEMIKAIKNSKRWWQDEKK